jgi:transcriptional regulator with XRE-family HTH domain
MTVGEIIKKRRKELNLTQGDLASGICTQAMISKIERDGLEPNGKIINQIAEKLRVKVSYLYGDQPTISEDKQLSGLKQIIYDEMQLLHSDKVDLLVTSNKDLIKLSVASEDILFFNWVEGWLIYFRDNDPESALYHLNKIDIEKLNNSDLALKIYITIASIYSNISKHYEALEIYEKINFKMNNRTNIAIRAAFIYNYALTLRACNQPRRALSVAIEGIEIVQKEQSLKCLGDLYWLKGKLFTDFCQFEEANDAYQISLVVFRMLQDEKKRALILVDLHEAKDRVNTNTSE